MFASCMISRRTAMLDWSFFPMSPLIPIKARFLSESSLLLQTSRWVQLFLVCTLPEGVKTTPPWAQISHRWRCNIKRLALAFSGKPIGAGQDSPSILIPPLGFFLAMTACFHFGTFLGTAIQAYSSRELLKRHKYPFGSARWQLRPRGWDERLLGGPTSQ